MRGTLFLVVGPSGAGKDTLIAAARAQLGSEFVFPRRVITRPGDAGGEDHMAETLAGFEARERTEDFALSWRAHGLAYGVPATIATDLAQGRHVVVNVSRSILPQALAKFAPAKVILVTANADVLEARLAARRRESADELVARLGRLVEALGEDAVIVNEGPVKDAIEAFVATLKG